jgi:hypothetical protein
MNILCIESFCPQKRTHNRTLLFGSTLLKHGRHFDPRNQPLNIRINYLDCHEAGLCCYLVIHIENLLRPLQLLYFHLWPIYWLSVVFRRFLVWILAAISIVLSEVFRCFAVGMVPQIRPRPVPSTSFPVYIHFHSYHAIPDNVVKWTINTQNTFMLELVILLECWDLYMLHLFATGKPFST